MITPIPRNFRSIALPSILFILITPLYIVRNSKDKNEYNKSVGEIEYLSLRYNNLPSRDLGNYKYLKIKNYPYVFEIYEPNSIKVSNTVDSLKVGDEIEVYYYETSNTREEKLNRFTQFIDHQNQAYFIRDSFQKQLGIIIIIINLIVLSGGFIFYKKGNLPW